MQFDGQAAAAATRPRWSVITLFHQRRALARDYLAAWQRERESHSSGSDIEWLFGDSASTDGTRELLLATAAPWAFIETHADNIGFARGNNSLAARARGEILLFLNYDIGFTDGWLDELRRGFEGRSKLGVLGNVQLSVRSRATDHAGIFFTPEGLPYHFRPSATQLGRLDLLPVPAVTGACLAIRRDLFESIGGFHDGYRTSYEDIELCVQARRRGFAIAVATRSVIWHYIGASPGRQDHEAANARIFAERCGPQARSLARFLPPDLPALASPAAPIQTVTGAFATLQVYDDRGAGFDESRSTVHLVRRGRWARVEIPLTPPQDGRPTTLRLRLDPGNEPGRVAFSGLSIKAGRPRTTLAHLPARRLAAEAVVSGSAHRIGDARGLEIESTGSDPQVIVDLSPVAHSLPRDAVIDIWMQFDPHPAPPPASPRANAHGSWRDVLSRRRVLVDLMRLSPGGLNGGVKVLVIELLEAVARRRRFRLKVDVVAHPEVCREIAVLAPSVAAHPVSTADTAEAVALARTAHVLYAPLGFSTVSRPDLPQVSLIVDLLHRDIDGALPEFEIAAREKWLVETLCRSDVLQCNSRFVVDRLQHHYGRTAAELLVIYNAVGISASSATPARPASPPYFLYPANDWPHKNHDRLLAAYALYRARSRAPWDLKLSGHFADPDRMNHLIARCGVGAATIVLGHLPAAEFARVFAQASALVFPSRYEGFGIPVLEAFRLGVPVICSHAASIPEVGADACGYFDPAEVDSIAAAMKRIEEDTAWREGLVASGRTRAQAFDLAQEADKLADALLTLGRRR